MIANINKQKAIHIALMLVGAYIFFRYLLDFVLPFLIGFAVALLLEPLVRFLVERGGFPRGLASFVSVLVLTLAGAGLGVWGISSLTREAGEFIEVAPSYISAAQEWLADYPYIPVGGLLARAGEWISAQSIRAVTFVPAMILGLLLILISAFFFSRDRDMFYRQAAKICPPRLAHYARPIGKSLHHAAAGFLKTEFIVLAIIAVICIAAMWFIGNPYPILFGIVIALLDALPIVGAGLILWPWAGYLFFIGQHSQGAVLLVLFGVITLIQNVLGPRILGEKIGMHPLAAIMSIFIGIKAFGPLGLLAGPAMVIVAKSMYTKG